MEWLREFFLLSIIVIGMVVMISVIDYVIGFFIRVKP